MKQFLARAKVILLCLAAGLGVTHAALAQSSVVISNQSVLATAALQGGQFLFTSNATVLITGSASTIQVVNNLILDGTVSPDGSTNTATISRTSGTGPLFIIRSNGTLTLLNLTLTGGLFTNGGAIYNDLGGTLIISNCVFTGNTATNFAGVAGLTATIRGTENGGNGGDGGSASGGAIYSRGTLAVYDSIFQNNTVMAGNGGDGGNGFQSGIFGGNAGNGGNGGSAFGGAVACLGKTNIFYYTEFSGNHCIAGQAGSAGTPATGAFSGIAGNGGIGGSAEGGGLFATGPVDITNCLFTGNAMTAGNTFLFSMAGAPVMGGGAALVGADTTNYIVDTTFYLNTGSGGAGAGNSSRVFLPAGNGGGALGGGLVSAAALTLVQSCTLATNLLTGGTPGTSSTSLSNGIVGKALGFQLARTAGTVKVSDSLFYGGTNATVTNLTTTVFMTFLTNLEPNVVGGFTDLGHNFSSDTTVALSSSVGSIEDGFLGDYPIVDTVLSSPGNIAQGLLGSASEPTLAVLFQGFQVIPGIPGITFPAYDQVFQPRSSPTTIGAYEASPLDVADTPATPQNFLITATGDPTVSVGTGGTAQFMVDTDGNPSPIGFQWQRNGSNLMDNGRISGSWSDTLTISNVTTNDAGSYSVIVGTSTLVAGGVISSDTNYLSVYVPVTIEVQPPKLVKPVPGRPLNLSVTATGAPPLTFQWYLNGTNALSDREPNITGSTTSNLTIYPLDATDAGVYSVVVGNQFGDVTSSNVVLSIPRPSLTILATMSTVTNSFLQVAGTAAGEFGVTNVLYEFEGTTNSADPGNNGFAQWTASLFLNPGTNVFTAYSIDILGQTSPASTIKIFYSTLSTLSLVTSGSGKITHTFAGNSLVTGRNYIVTAVPDPGWLFSSWSIDGTNTTANPLTIFLQGDDTVIANFIPNFFIPISGTYNGLFAPDTGVTEASSGMLTGLILRTNGAFSGKLSLAGTSYALAGSFDINGNANLTVGTSKTPGGPISVSLMLSPLGDGLLAGTIVNNNFTANLFAEQAILGGPSAEYTILLPPSAAAPANTPPGTGYLLVTNHAGTVTLSGALADGTAFNETVPIPANGDVPVYASIYNNTGLLYGWINLNTLASTPPTNSLTWIKAASAAKMIYPAGFSNTVSVVGGPWLNPPAKTVAVAFPSGLLVVSNSSIALTYTVSVSNNNALVKLGNQPANVLTGSVNPKTGLLNIVFGNGKGTTAGVGAVLQSLSSGGGYFVTTTNAGVITLGTNVAGLAPIIYQQPASQNFALNATVAFTVGAIGSPPLSYQWMLDGTNIVDGGNIAGSATSRLTLSPALLADGGSYSVVVSSSDGTVASAVAVLAVPPPTVAIKPVMASVSVPNLTILGTATGKFGLGGVFYQLNNGPALPATSANNGATWSAALTLTPGTNLFSAYSVDPAGHPSATQTVKVFYLTMSTITLQTSGPGKITANFTGTSLAVGRNYTVTAVPGAGYILGNWTGTITTTSNPLTFLMVPDMALTANFVPNPFVPLAGTYNGLFSAADGVAVESAGFLNNLILKTNGAFTGKLFIAGTNYAIAGTFDATGSAAITAGPLTLDLSVQEGATNLITGTVAGANFSSPLFAEIAGVGQPSADYTMLMAPSSSDITNVPPGDGYALLTNHAGQVTLMGALADGSPYSQAVPASASGDVPIYASPYGGVNSGLLFGWINLGNLQAVPPAYNYLTWIKKANNTKPLYPSGFTNSLVILGSTWTTQPANTPAITLSKGTLEITNTSGDMLDFTVAVLGDSSIVKLGGAPPNSLTGSIAPTTGLLKLTFGNGTNASVTSAFGAVLQDAATGGGYYLTSTNAGAVSLHP